MIKNFILISTIIFMACQFNNEPSYDAPLLINNYTKRINRYLNKSDDVWNHILLNEEGIQIFASFDDKTTQQPEFTLHWKDVETYRNLLENNPNEAFQWYKTNHQISKEVAIPSSTIDTLKYGDLDRNLPLKGFRIALDAGHIAGNLPLAELEGKNIQMRLRGRKGKGKSKGRKVAFFESELNWYTARILQLKLEELGATVLMTRDAYDKTAFGQTYTEWYAKYDTTPKPRPQLLFHRYFKHEDNKERIAKINAFQPHLTLIIHYNVDANNAPWKQPTKQNASMAFVGGSFMQGELFDIERRFNFLRLLLTQDIERSVDFSKAVLDELNKQLAIPSITPENDQAFLERSSILTSAQGVYARNLALSARVHGTLCYAEPLYQDNEAEVRFLAKRDYEVDGRKVSGRLADVAEVYFKAIVEYLKQQRMVKSVKETDRK